MIVTWLCPCSSVMNVVHIQVCPGPVMSCLEVWSQPLLATVMLHPALILTEQMQNIAL